MAYFEIKDLCVECSEKKIINGFSIKVEKGEIHAIMGPNGSGKTTLGNAIAGHPACKTAGEIIFNGKEISKMKPEERAKLGIFLSFQSPPFIDGISLLQLLKKSYFEKNNLKENDLSAYEQFRKRLSLELKELSLSESHLTRDANKNFSGGERKKAEVLQIRMLGPELIILDEIDSGLDVDSMRLIANSVKKMMDGKRSLLVITHYSRILGYLRPNFVHVMKNGRIEKSGPASLAGEIEKIGYYSK